MDSMGCQVTLVQVCSRKYFRRYKGLGIFQCRAQDLRMNYAGATSHVVHEICSSHFYPRQQTVENDSKDKA